MLTRAFLLLLAMMGLSAAQAADCARASHGTAIAAALASLADEAAETAAVAAPRPHLIFLVPCFRIVDDPLAPAAGLRPQAITTRLSDRQRA